MTDRIVSHADAYQVNPARADKSFSQAIHAILLDRDGVINQERADYVKSWQEFVFLPGALTALCQLADLNLPIGVVTNQSAIGRGIVTRATVDAIHQQLQRRVEQAGGRINAFFICPHQPADHCSCRKPQPGLLLQAAHLFNIDLAHAIFIGDALTDLQAAQAAGCQAILVRSGRQGQQLQALYGKSAGVMLHANLATATSYILHKLALGN